MTERTCGASRSENAGMSNERQVRILSAARLRFPGAGSSAQGKSGPKARSKDVVDGQQVEIPVLQCIRNVGTQTESRSREWRNRCKRGRRTAGKSAVQFEDVTRSEIKVAKPVSWLSGKAAIVYIVPVP